MFNESPFMMIAIIWLCILGIVAVLAYFHYKRRQLISMEIIAAIEKGIDVPFPSPRKTNRFTQGIFWTVIGLALLLALAVTSNQWDMTIWALIPIAVGLAALLAYFFDRKKND